jgi:protein-S-isoprenylcysteine O-methyltransferase Ste14
LILVRRLSLAVRSVLWAALLPGVVAGYVPWRYFGLTRLRLDLLRMNQAVGLASVGLGVVLLGACIWWFARVGQGTLAPVDPPRELVVRGLYRYVRNPMYLSVTAIVLGEAVMARSRPLFLYWAAFFVAANLFVIGYEEPALRRRFGEPYVRYTERVGRWLPRFRPMPCDAAASKSS